jgi:hypothetical protein
VRDSRAGRAMLVSESSLDVDSESLLSVNVGDAGEAGRRVWSVVGGRSAWARVVARALRDKGIGLVALWCAETFSCGGNLGFCRPDAGTGRSDVSEGRGLCG